MNERQKEGIEDRADQHNNDKEPHGISCGSQMWLYLDRVKEGYAMKLAHMWYGLFLGDRECGELAVRLEVHVTPYRLFPIVHISKLKLIHSFPDRPVARLKMENNERVDFD